MTNEQKEAAFATFLGIASRDLREGRYLHALVIFGSLAKIEFTRRRDALQGEAVALVRMGQFKEAYRDAEKKFKKIVEMHDAPTVFKADTLKALAEVSLGLEHYTGIDEILKEAADIYSEQGLTKANGSIVHMQGLVALHRGDIEDALWKFNWASTLSEIKVPEVVPSGFGIEAMPEPTTTESARLLALAGAHSS